MHREERVLRWEPNIGLPRNLDTPVLTNDYEHGLQLILAESSADGRAFSVQFEKPIAFRSANESYRLELIQSLADLPWRTFKIAGSRWVDWFHDETNGIYHGWTIQHFVFVGEDIVEVCPALNPDLRKSSERLHSGGYNCRKCMVVLSKKSGCVLTVYGME
jgi:hypothetical protein